MKKIIANSLFAIRTLIVVLCIVCGAVPAWSHGTHYARVTVTASPSGNGKVYMTTDANKVPASGDWVSTMSEDWNCDDGIGPSENDNRTYYVHAQAESGYHFEKWSSNSSGTDSRSTEYKYAYSTSASGSSDNPTANNIYAIFAANPTYTATFLTTENGSYTYQYGSSGAVTVTTEQSVTTNLNFALTATPDAGYELYGWYTESGGTKTYFDYSSYSLPSYALPGNVRIGVDFMPIGTPLFQIKGAAAVYTDLNAAVAACDNQTKTIVLINNGTLPAGDYTIPANVTLLIPFDAAYTCYTATPGVTSDAYISPTAYRTLTMSPGAHLTVNGKISVSAKLSGKRYAGPCGAPSDTYGAIKMLSEGETKSTITLNNGAKLYSWGYIYGEGAVEVLSGAEVDEGFAFMDFCGAQNTYDMTSDAHKVFPFNQYYVQNIEVPLTIHQGATEKVYSYIYAEGDISFPITLVGDEGLFRLSGAGSKMTKWYDPKGDRQHYALQGNASISKISFTITYIMSINVSSDKFILPITNNMDITVRNGATVNIEEDVCIMADASITVEEGATMNIASGKNVYVYDKNAYTNAGTYSTNRGGYPDAGPGRYALGNYIRRISFSPSWATTTSREIRRLQNMGSARFLINGTLNASGKIYTTEGGADIRSEVDGATMNLTSGAGNSTVTYQVDHQNYDAYYYSIPITSAKLHNADASYAETADNAAGTTWTYANGHWGWCIVWRLEDGTVLKRLYHYAQPNAAWLASNAPTTDRAPEGTCSYVFTGWNQSTHTASQEIEMVADYTKNCAEYYTVTWKSEDGTETLETDENVGQGEATRFNGTAPTKPIDQHLLYTFDGWSTTPNGEKVYGIGATPPATDIATYYAHFAVTDVAAVVIANGENTYCTTIEEAFEVANSASYTPTIQVWKNTTATETLTYTGKNHCTLDLNGHTISGTAQPLLTINDEGFTVTITDHSPAQEGKLHLSWSNTGNVYVVQITSGVLCLEAGTIHGQNTGSGATAGVYANNRQEVIMTGVKIQVEAKGTAYGIFTQGKATVNGGTIQVESATKSAYSVQAYGANGNAIINDGYFSAAGVSTVTCLDAASNASAVVQGGYFNTNANLDTYKAATCRVYSLPSTKLPYRYTVTEKTPIVASVTINSVTTEYSSFAEAWTAANTATAASTLKLLDDVDLASYVTYNNSNKKNCTLDLNGHRLTALSNIAVIVVDKAGTVFTITDSSEDETGKVYMERTTNTNTYGVYINAGTLRLEAGTIEVHAKASTNGHGSVYTYKNSAAFTMTGGKIYVENTASNAHGLYNKGTMTINGGSIQVKSTNGIGYGVRWEDNYAVIFNGGKMHVTGTNGASIATSLSSTPSVVLQGGYYNDDLEESLATYTSAPYYVFPASLTEEELTYTCKVAEGYTLTWTTDGELSGEGYTPSGLTEVGTPIVAPTPIKAGYTFYGWTPAVAAAMPSADTEYTAQWAVASVTINDATTLYTDFNTAWSAANSATAESTIKLLSDITVTSKLTYDNSNTQNCTLDLNGHTLTSSTGEQSPLHINKTGVTFTITDSGESGMLLLNTTSTSTIFGVYAEKGSLILTGGTIEARSGSATTGAVTVNANGTFTMEGGTLHVVTTNNRNGRGVYSYNNVTINDGTIHVEAAGTGYGIYLDANKKATVNGGKFNISGSTANKSCICNTTTANTNLLLLGGWYNTNLMTDGTTASNINTKYVAPGKSCNYHVFDLEGESPYLYKVAEGYTVTFNNYDDTSLQSSVWEKGTTPTYSGETPTKPADAQYIYTFNGWSPAISSVTADATYTATFTETINNYTVTVVKNVDDYGSISSTEITSVPYGSSITVEGNTFTVNGTTVTATPETSDAQYTYTFDGWTNAPGTVTSDVTITANFTRTVNNYTVLWKNADGTTLETDEDVPYGTTLTYDGATPTKATDEEGIYTFNGWSPAVGAITDNTEYTATYSTTPVVASVTISGATTYYTTFNTAWTAANSATAASTIKLLSDITATSILTYNNSNTQDCTLDLNGHTISSTQQAVLNPTKADITFTLTDHSENHNGKLLSNATATNAAYGILVSAGTFVMENGTIEAHLPASTSQGIRVANGASFTMNGGTIEVETTNNKSGCGVFANTTGTATIHGGEIRVHAAATGYAVNVAGTTTITGGKFSASGSSSACIHKASGTLTLQGGYYSTDTDLDAYCATNYHVFPNEDATYIYKVAEGYTVTFNNYDGTTLQTGLREKNTTPVYSGDTPTKPEDAQYTYAFSGWDPEVVAVTADAIYTAQFSPTTKTYTVTWKDADGSTLRIDENVPYGTMPSYGSTPTKATDASYVYTFAGWTPDLSSVTGDVTYTATYNTTPVVASVMNNSTGYTLYYTDFNAAFTAAKEATVAVTITLLQDVSSSVLQYSGKNTDCTLDLNGHTFTSTATQLILNVNKEGSTFTITDKTESKLGQMRIVSTRTDEAYGVYIRSGHLILEAGTIYASLAAATCAGVRAVNANSSFTMNGGTIQLVTTNSNDGYGIMRTGGTVMVNDGKLNISASGSAYVTNQANNTYVKIYGGYYNIDSNLSTACATNYYVFPNSDEIYRFKVASSNDIVVNGDEIIDVNTTVNTTIVHVSGILTVTDGVKLTTTDLILEATPSSSGEIIGDVEVAQNAYFDLSQPGGFKAKTWYAVAVPWQVDVPAYEKENNGVYLTNDGVSYTQQELGRSFDLIYYDGAKRAAEGHSDDCWKYVEDDADAEHIMYPGRAYMIYLISPAQTIRFERKSETELHTNTLAVYEYASGNPKDASWNGIANPATFHAYIDPNADTYEETENAGQIYHADSRSYSVVNMSASDLVVGQPIFVQATESKALVPANPSHGKEAPYFAPRHARAQATPLTRYELMLADDADVTDRVIVRMNENKEEDTYLVGQDLIKMGVSAVVPQMWVNRYDAQLCVNTVAGYNHSADYPLGIFAPKDGEYDLFIDPITNEQSPTNLYLTYDGEAIWNLSDGGYVASLNKGTNTHYGLRIVAKSPQIATGIDEAVVDAKGETRKVMINDKVFIIRNGETYSVTGQKTK